MIRVNWIGKIFLPLTSFFLLGATHLGPTYSTRPLYALDAFGKGLAKEYRLQFLNSGTGRLADAEKGIWAISLVSRQQMTLEEGRQLATAIAHTLLDKVFKDPSFARYCQETSTRHRGPELKKEYIGFRLAFWDENTNRSSYPFLAQIRLADGKLYFHYADPETQALQDPIVEAL